MSERIALATIALVFACVLAARATAMESKIIDARAPGALVEGRPGVLEIEIEMAAALVDAEVRLVMSGGLSLSLPVARELNDRARARLEFVPTSEMRPVAIELLSRQEPTVIVARRELALEILPAGTLRVLVVGELPEVAGRTSLARALSGRVRLIASADLAEMPATEDVLVLGDGTISLDQLAQLEARLPRVLHGVCTLVLTSAAAENIARARWPGGDAAFPAGTGAILPADAGWIVRASQLDAQPEFAGSIAGVLENASLLLDRARVSASPDMHASTGGMAPIVHGRATAAFVAIAIALLSTLLLAWIGRAWSPALQGAAHCGLSILLCLLLLLPAGVGALGVDSRIDVSRVVLISMQEQSEIAIVEERLTCRARADFATVGIAQESMQAWPLAAGEWSGGQLPPLGARSQHRAHLARGAQARLRSRGVASILGSPISYEETAQGLYIGNSSSLPLVDVLVLRSQGAADLVAARIEPGALVGVRPDPAQARAVRRALGQELRLSQAALPPGGVLVLARVEIPAGRMPAGVGHDLGLANSLPEIQIAGSSAATATLLLSARIR